MKWIALVLAVAVSPASAQGSFEAYDPSILQVCLENNEMGGGDPSTCIGLGAAICIEGEAGSSNVSYGMCMSAEWQDWDDRLNEAYAIVLQQQREFGVHLRDVNPAFPNPDEVMRDMQRAWIKYRDLACDWERIQWAGGTGAGPAAAQCMLELTARQMLFLNARGQ
ncbi:DUF1311 domain-containing protein [Rhodobacteraceae bacterium S2214]|nr:DUF1311 domain-containing protein [Rhodobacteraceae bacterium S2214]